MGKKYPVYFCYDVNGVPVSPKIGMARCIHGARVVLGRHRGKNADPPTFLAVVRRMRAATGWAFMVFGFRSPDRLPPGLD